MIPFLGDFSNNSNVYQTDTQNDYQYETNQNSNLNENAYTTYYNVAPKEDAVYYESQIHYTKNKLKDLLAFFVTILCIIGCGFLLWKIPFTNKILVSLYNDNPPIKAVVDFIINIFSK